MTTAHLDAARALGALLATEDGRRHLRLRGHVPGRPIVLFDHFERMVGVVDRLRRHTEAQSALLGVYFPERDGLEFLTVSPCDRSTAEHVADEDGGPVDGRTQIGMVVDFMKTRPNRPYIFRLSQWDPELGIKSEELVDIDG